MIDRGRAVTQALGSPREAGEQEGQSPPRRFRGETVATVSGVEKATNHRFDSS